MILTLWRIMTSFSVNLSPVRGCSQSFLIIFSTHSNVTTSPLQYESTFIKVSEQKKVLIYVVLITAQGTELLSTSPVTGHLYLSTLAINDFLSSGSFNRVNLIGNKSFTFRTVPVIGQYIVLSYGEFTTISI
jgi:hypothetical protein